MPLVPVSLKKPLKLRNLSPKSVSVDRSSYRVGKGQNLDANAVAIALAIKDGKLWTKVQKGRLGDYFAIGDEQGLIEVALDEAELNAWVADVRERAEIGVLEGLGSVVLQIA